MRKKTTKVLIELPFKLNQKVNREKEERGLKKAETIIKLLEEELG